MKKYTASLLIVAGILFMLVSILGDGKTELVPIGIMFFVIGVATRQKNKASQPE